MEIDGFGGEITVIEPGWMIIRQTPRGLQGIRETIATWRSLGWNQPERDRFPLPEPDKNPNAYPSTVAYVMHVDTATDLSKCCLNEFLPERGKMPSIPMPQERFAWCDWGWSSTHRNRKRLRPKPATVNSLLATSRRTILSPPKATTRYRAKVSQLPKRTAQADCVPRRSAHHRASERHPGVGGGRNDANLT